MPLGFKFIFDDFSFSLMLKDTFVGNGIWFMVYTKLLLDPTYKCIY